MYEKRKYVDLTLNERKRMRAALLKEALLIEESNKDNLPEVVVEPKQLEVEVEPLVIEAKPPVVEVEPLIVEVELIIVKEPLEVKTKLTFMQKIKNLFK